MAMNFAATVNSTVVAKFSAAVLKLEQLGDLDHLQTTFLRPPSTCSQESSNTEPIGFSKVSKFMRCWLILSMFCIVMSSHGKVGQRVRYISLK